MLDLSPYTAQLKELEEQLKAPWPTPPVGTFVQWFNRNDVADPGAVCAAVVTKVDGPAKVCLTIFPPNGMPKHKVGVYFTGHPVHENKVNAQTDRNGSWGYPPEVTVAPGHYKLHTDSLNIRKQAIERDMASLKASIRDKKSLNTQ